MKTWNKRQITMGNSILKGSLALILSFILAGVYAQGTYTSLDNRIDAWENASIWSKEFSWMADGPPGPDVAGSYVVKMNGYVTRNGSLSATGGSTIHIFDTLVVKGDFTVASSVNVHPGGILIVLGNFTSTSSSGNKLQNNGNVVVTGAFSHSGGKVKTKDQVYSFDNSPSFSWGASVNNVSYNGGNSSAMAAELKSQSDLSSDNPILSAFVTNLMGVNPVELVDFNVAKNGSYVVITWATVSEINFDYFSIERSKDGKNFSEIGRVNGSGSTSSRSDYSFNDYEPVLGRAFYRIKSVDFDHAVEYFNIKTIEFEGEQNLSVYPNPVTGNHIDLNVNFTPDSSSTVMIMNMSGMVVASMIWDAESLQQSMDLSLEAGIYVLKFQSEGFSKIERLLVR